MNSFKRTNIAKFAKVKADVTEDTIYWKQLAAPVLVKEFGPIDYIDFSCVEPYCFAVTCSVRVQVYNPVTKSVWKNLTRFQEAAYGGTFRSDGRLLCAGGEESLVRMFDVSSKTPLRVFKGHTAPVHRCNFTIESTKICSFSDDMTVRLWDIPTETELHKFVGHNEYIRAGAVSPTSPNIILSGCYDNTIKLFDTRTTSEVLNVNHGAPVESVLFLPTGGIFISAGGTEIKVWDALAGGRLLAHVSQHHRTITCLSLASNGERLLSGSLDRHVKIYNVSSYEVVHTLNYPNAVLSVGVSANDETVVAGMVDGLVSVSRRENLDKTPKKSQRSRAYPFISKKDSDMKADLLVREVAMSEYSKSDKHLRKFEYSAALDAALAPFVVNSRPEITVAVCHELVRRQALHRALAGRSEKSLSTVIRFLVKYASDRRFARTMIQVINVFLDIYEDSLDRFSSKDIPYLRRLGAIIRDEVALTETLSEVQGMLTMLLAGRQTTVILSTAQTKWAPSEVAQKNFVVNVS